ncbi:MAG: hypothetical protein AAGA25_09260, partial [Planctomycetota bacterium]
MPTPLIFSDGVDPITDAQREQATAISRVYLVSDRSRSDNPKGPADYFSNRRDHNLHVGVAEVDLAVGSDWEALDQASLDPAAPRPEIAYVDYTPMGKLWRGIPPRDAFNALNQDVSDAFLARLKEDLARSGADQIYIFVHGY